MSRKYTRAEARDVDRLFDHARKRSIAASAATDDMVGWESGQKDEDDMGTWGSDIFENDAALDLVEDVLKVATTEIEAFCESDGADVEDLEAILAGVAIHLALHQYCHASAPSLDTARQLREKVIRIYDEQIDSLEPDEDYKNDRRATIVATLDAYEKAARATSE